LVIAHYLLCNVCYLAVLPVQAIEAAPGGGVATLAVDTFLPEIGKLAMGGLIAVSTFGTVNALTLAGVAPDMRWLRMASSSQGPVPSTEFVSPVGHSLSNASGL
jgi:hypothetical protein